MPSRTPGLKIPSTPERDQMYRSLKVWCQSRGHELKDSQDSASTVPASDTQLAMVNVAITSQDRLPDPLWAAATGNSPAAAELSRSDAFMPKWAFTWADELNACCTEAVHHGHSSYVLPSSRVVSKRDVLCSSVAAVADVPHTMPSWASEWAEELDQASSGCMKHETGPTKPLPAVRLRSRSPGLGLTCKPKPSSAPHLRGNASTAHVGVNSQSISNAVGCTQRLPDLVRLGVQLASNEKEINAAQEEFQRFVSDGSPVGCIEDVALFLMKMGLYGPPHNVKLIQSRGKSCGICVQPSFGGSLSVYIRTGKVNVQGPFHSKCRLLNMLKPVSQKSRPIGVEAGLPDPDCLRAKLRRV